MAYVYIYFHRNPRRLAPHLRYIGERPESRGLRGLGPAFRALQGDIAASIALMREHAASVRRQAGRNLRDGPFVRVLFTLPTPLAERVMAADHRLPKGGERVLQDAVEATFRSVARHLQGVYAMHFHASSRHAHPHVHVDLSPLDQHGRTVFLTGRQRELLRSTWEREVVRALERAERRDPTHVPAPEERTRASWARVHEAGLERPRTRPARALDVPSRSLVVLTSWVLRPSEMPLVDLVTRAVLARAGSRLRLPLPSRAARFGFGLMRGPLRPIDPLRFFPRVPLRPER